MTIEERKSLSVEFRRYLWAAILIALSGCLGNIVDAIIVGNLIGEDGVSAINLSKPMVQLMFTLSMLLSTGAGMLVGYALGKKEKRHAKYIYTQSMLGSLIAGILFTIFAGILFPEQVTRLLCNNEHLFQMTYDYLRIMMLGAPAYMLMWGLSTMVGVDGQPKLVSVAVIVDNVVNLCLDIVFIQWLDWGIIGSSAATVVGHLVGIAILLSHWWKPEHRRLIPSFAGDNLGSLTSTIIKQGAPLAVASISLTLLLLSANTIVLGTLGRTGIFAFAVCMNLLQVYNLFLSGTCQTLQSLGAIQVGKGDTEGLRLVLRKAFRFITVAMLITCGFVWIDPEAVAKFFGAEEPAMILETDHALRVFALSFIPFCYIYVLMIVYKLYSHHRLALFISFALSLTVIPVLWLVARVAPEYLWYSYLLAYIIELSLIFVFHKVSHIQFVLGENKRV